MAHPYAARPVAATHVWLTPPAIVSALGPFDLDPCAAPSPRPWGTARRHIELPEDGLTVKWEGFVWMNPPFGDETKHWLAKLSRHNHGIALCFARTETKMFFEHVWPVASAVLFLKWRPHFYTPEGREASGNSGGPIVLVGYGDEAHRRLESCESLGKFISLRPVGLRRRQEQSQA